MRNNKSIQKILASFSVLMALSVVFTSCKKELEETDPAGAPSELTVSVVEGDETVPLTEGTTVDLFAIEGEGSIVAQATATAAQQGQLTGVEAITAVMKDGIQLAAYNPSGLWTIDTYGQPLNFKVSTDQSSKENYEAADLKMAPLTSVVDGKAALVMEHVMAKVSVHITDVTGNYDLSTVGMIIPGIHTSVTADLAQHTVTTVENETADIIPYSNKNPYRASASVVVAPGKVKGGNVLIRVTVQGETFTYNFPEDADWQAGTETVYNMRLTYEGLAPYGSYVTAWGDGENNLTGNLEEVRTYGIGDYLLADGKFVKADQLTEEQAASVIAVVFSYDVSKEDAAAGYNAYVMGVKCVTGKNYGIITSVGENVQDYPIAFADLNGRTNTEKLMAGAEYQALADKEKSVFGSLDAYTQEHPLPSSAGASGWFVPSFGQMMQILNNLGKAGLTADTGITVSSYNPMYQSTDVEVFDRINASVETVNGEKILSTEAKAVYVTSTEADANFWCVQSLTNDGWKWAFGRNPGRSGGDRSLLPCAAVKLP
ncbi:fimbrillin family protein [Bacteroides mediterraneensis]|uniref:fimbrillin family protein n=1 Tax=Bacteroides mediterraneensis TaxID=1841856 RepID=UPI0026EFDCB8|nr:fimbrillin family protein [Bacteroides mediterraneensis]